MIKIEPFQTDINLNICLILCVRLCAVTEICVFALFDRNLDPLTETVSFSCFWSSHWFKLGYEL